MKVLSFLMGWSVKDVAHIEDVYAELKRPQISRRARFDESQSNVIAD